MPGTCATLGPEWEFLLAACSVASPEEKLDRMHELLQRPVQWTALAELADQHGVQPLLYQAVQGVEGVPPEVMHSLRQGFQTNLHKALLLSRELIRIMECLSALGVEVMPYKGPALAEVIYGDIAQRKSGDIDLLIHAQDVARVREAVRALGYTPQLVFSAREERAYLRSGYEFAFDGEAGPNLLELQWAILPRFYAVDFDMEGFFRRAVTVPVAGRPMKTPSPADLLLILSVHAAKHVWGRLVWLCDIARLMTMPNLDWEWIGSQARELGIARILCVTIMLAQELLGATIPDHAQRNLPKDNSLMALTQQIKTLLAQDNAADVESLAYFRLMLQMRERQSDRLRFLQRLALTPGPSEWQAIRLPGSLFPLYRLVRISRLVARFVRA